MTDSVYDKQEGRTSAPLDSPWCDKPALDGFQKAKLLGWILNSNKPKSIAGPDEVSLPGLTVGDRADETDRVIVKKNGPVHIAYYKAQESSVRLDTGGSGFFVSGDGLIVTASHAVPIGSRAIGVDTVNGAKYIAEMISRDVNNDLALLKVASVDRPPKVPFLQLNTKDAYGETLAATGHPKRWASVYISMGRAQEKPFRTSHWMWRNSSDLLTMSAHVEGGNSGGAVIDLSGDVRGVLVGTHGWSDRAIVVPSKNIENLLKWTEQARTKKIDHHGGYRLASYEQPLNKSMPAIVEDIAAKESREPDARDPRQDRLSKPDLPESNQRPKRQPPEWKEQQLPKEWLKNPGVDGYVSPYGKIYKDSMNYYEQKKVTLEK